MHRGPRTSASARFLPPDTLRAKYAALGIEPGTDVIAYCGSGVSADLLALESIGITRARLRGFLVGLVG